MIALALMAAGIVSLLTASGALAGPPQATTVTSEEQRLAPGQTKTFLVSCPRGYILTDTNIQAETSLGGSDRSDPKIWGLRVVKEQIGLSSMVVDITNNGNEALKAFAYGRCVRRVVRLKVPVKSRARTTDKPFLVWLKQNSVEEQKGMAGGAQRNDCGPGRQAIGHGLSNLPVFHPLSVLATVIVVRRFTRWTLNQPDPSLREIAEVLAYRSLCTSLRARVTRAGKKPKRRAKGQSNALAAANPRARVVVRRIRRNRKVPPHADPNQTSRIAVACPKRFTATSYGWDAGGTDANPVPVQLRRSLYPNRRKVAAEVTNTSGAARTVSLTAICLTFRIRR